MNSLVSYLQTEEERENKPALDFLMTHSGPRYDDDDDKVAKSWQINLERIGTYNLNYELLHKQEHLPSSIAEQSNTL